MESRSQKTNAEITSLLRSRSPLLWIASREEGRVEAALMNSLPAKTRMRFWDCISGLSENLLQPDGKTKLVPLGFTAANSYGNKSAKLSPLTEGGQPCIDQQMVLQAIRECTDRCLYVLRDINAFKDAFTIRALRNTATEIATTPSSEQRSIIVLTPSSEIPQDLIGQASLIEYPLPDRGDIEKIFRLLPLTAEGITAPDSATTEAAIDAALGLSAVEVQACFNRSLVTLRKIDPVLIAGEKKRAIAREKVLTWSDPEPLGMSAVGGLENVKEWLEVRKAAFSKEAREFGLPTPKGMILAGIPGTGKSLIPKCLATGWGVPLLKLDLSGLKSKWQGDSEANIRKALATITSVGRCVVLLDEFEKAIAGSESSAGDSGTSADQLGTLLQFFQERDCAAFFVATLNDPRKMPPELLRKGRFDEFFWVDMPTRVERAEILNASLRKFGRTNEGINCPVIVKITAGWTGAEIASLIPDALFIAFNDGARNLSTEDLLTAAKNVVPLSITMSKKLEEIRGFMKDKARPASKPECEETEDSASTSLLDLST